MIVLPVRIQSDNQTRSIKIFSGIALRLHAILWLCITIVPASEVLDYPLLESVRDVHAGLAGIIGAVDDPTVSLEHRSRPGVIYADARSNVKPLCRAKKIRGLLATRPLILPIYNHLAYRVKYQTD